MSNSQLRKSKSEIKNSTEVTLNLSSNVVGDSNDKNNFPHKLLLLINTQVSKLREAFANDSSANIKLSKTQLHKAGQSDAAIDKKMFGSGNTTLIVSNEENNDVMKIIKSLEESGSLIKDVRETIKTEAKEQKGRCFGMLLGTLSTTLLGNLWKVKVQLEQVEALLQQVKIFNAASSFNKFWNTKVILKWT